MEMRCDTIRGARREDREERRKGGNSSRIYTTAKAAEHQSADLEFESTPTRALGMRRSETNMLQSEEVLR